LISAMKQSRRPARIAERNPVVLVALRLALHEAVAGVRPEHDLLALIVEDELAFVVYAVSTV